MTSSNLDIICKILIKGAGQKSRGMQVVQSNPFPGDRLVAFAMARRAAPVKQ